MARTKIAKVWQLQEAKNKLSAVVEEATRSGPQVISRRGVEAAVVLSFADYSRLVKPKRGLVQFLMGSPLRGSGLDLSRSKDTGRDVDL